jgi:hypothetical protein
MTTTAFQDLATKTAEAFGLATLRMVVLPHPVNTLPMEQLAALANRAVPEVVQKLTEG